jgi:hypothetical protein
MEVVLPATSIIPNLYNEQVDDDTVGREDIVDDLTYDVFNLTACNYHPVRLLNPDDKENEICSIVQRSTQLLLKRFIFLLVM